MIRGIVGFAVSLSLGFALLGCHEDRRDSPTIMVPPPSPGKKKPMREENSPETQALIDQEKEEALLEPDPPAGATAQCLDDTYSFDTKKDRACVEHRGIKKWLLKKPAK